MKAIYATRPHVYSTSACLPKSDGDDSAVVGIPCTPKLLSPGVDAVGSSISASIEPAETLAPRDGSIRRTVHFMFFGDTDDRWTGLDHFSRRSDISLRKIHSYHHLQVLATPGARTRISGKSHFIYCDDYSLSRSGRPFGVEREHGSYVDQLSDRVKRTFQLISVGGDDSGFGKPCDTIENTDLDELEHSTSAHFEVLHDVFALDDSRDEAGLTGGECFFTGPKNQFFSAWDHSATPKLECATDSEKYSVSTRQVELRTLVLR